MRPLPRPVLGMLCALYFLNTTAMFSAAGPSQANLAERIQEAAVRIQYQLQFDGTDAPTGGLGLERCPNCGNYHQTDLQTFLTDKRPVEAAGYLIGPNRIVSLDPLIHPRFLKSVTVRRGKETVPASLTALARDWRGVLLETERPLSASTPLTFEGSSEEPVWLAFHSQESGRWVTIVDQFPRSLIVPESGNPYRIASQKGIALSAAGNVVGVVLANRLSGGDDWAGSPDGWDLVSVKEVMEDLEKLKEDSAFWLPRVHLQFRSPRVDAIDDYMSSMSYGDEANQISDDATEAHVPGVLLPERRVLVLAALKPKLTARLESVQVWLGGRSLEAGFEYSLADYGAFTVRLDNDPPVREPDLYDGKVEDLMEKLLLNASVQIQGESRKGHFSVSRFSSCGVGPGGRLHPQLDSVGSESAHLFNDAGELVAIPVKRRLSLAEQDDYYWNYEEPELTPVAYVMDAIGQYPESADQANRPVSEEDAARLAWLGVELQPMNQDLARANGAAIETRDGEIGALVTYVHPDSPAEHAGIKSGSVLLRIVVPGQPLPIDIQIEEDFSSQQAFPWERLDEVPEQYFDRIPMPWPKVENAFVRTLTDLGFGKPFIAEWLDGGVISSSNFEVVPGPLHYNGAPTFHSAQLGVTVRDLTYEVRRYLQLLEKDPGVVVSRIDAGSAVSIAGVKPYELITHVGDQPVQDCQSFEELTRDQENMSLTVKRMNKNRIVTVNIQ